MPKVLGVLARQFESFNYDGKMGCATNITFDIELRPGAVIPKSSPCRLDPEREAFYENEMEKQFKRGILERGPIDMIINPVVVPKKGPKKWR